MIELPVDILNLIATYDRVIQCSLYPLSKLDYTYEFLYFALENGFTNQFLIVLPHTTLTSNQLEDCYEVAFLYRDIDCIDAILNRMSKPFDILLRTIDMCEWFEDDLKNKLQHTFNNLGANIDE